MLGGRKNAEFRLKKEDCRLKNEEGMILPRDPSLRLKSGSAQDGTDRFIIAKCTSVGLA